MPSEEASLEQFRELTLRGPLAQRDGLRRALIASAKDGWLSNLLQLAIALLDEDSRGPSQPLVGAPFQCNIGLCAGAEDRSQGSPRAKG